MNRGERNEICNCLFKVLWENSTSAEIIGVNDWKNIRLLSMRNILEHPTVLDFLTRCSTGNDLRRRREEGEDSSDSSKRQRTESDDEEDSSGAYGDNGASGDCESEENAQQDNEAQNLNHPEQDDEADSQESSRSEVGFFCFNAGSKSMTFYNLPLKIPFIHS